MAAPIVYKSTDGNAPVLSGTTGGQTYTLQGQETEPEDHFTLNPWGNAR